MKKITLILFSLFTFILFNIQVYAAPSASISVSSSTIEKGSSVTATLTIKNVASWQVTITSSGSTSGCTQTFSDVTSDGENTTKKLSVTCKSTSTGTINFVASGNATSSDGSKTQISTSKKVTVVTPREKSTNNKLKSLSVEGFEISPEFSKDVNEYVVNVPSTVDKITISASKADSYATLEGTGEKTIEEGTNSFEIIVTSETGISNTYKLIVNVEDLDPINVEIDGKKYTVVKVAKNLIKPELFEETTIKIGEYEIPAFINETSKYTLVGLKDDKGTIELFIYSDGKYEKYNDYNSNSITLVFLKPDKIPLNFKKTTMLINEQDTTIYYNNSEILVYGINIVTGEKNFYSYDKTEKTLQLFDIESYEKEIQEQQNNKYLVYGLSIGILLMLLLVMLLSSKCSKLSKLVKLNEKIKNIQVEKASLLEKSQLITEEIDKKTKNKKHKKNGKKH